MQVYKFEILLSTRWRQDELTQKKKLYQGVNKLFD